MIKIILPVLFIGITCTLTGSLIERQRQVGQKFRPIVTVSSSLIHNSLARLAKKQYNLFVKLAAKHAKINVCYELLDCAVKSLENMVQLFDQKDDMEVEDDLLKSKQHMTQEVRKKLIMMCSIMRLNMIDLNNSYDEYLQAALCGLKVKQSCDPLDPFQNLHDKYKGRLHALMKSNMELYYEKYSRMTLKDLNDRVLTITEMADDTMNFESYLLPEFNDLELMVLTNTVDAIDLQFVKETGIKNHQLELGNEVRVLEAIEEDKRALTRTFLKNWVKMIQCSSAINVVKEHDQKSKRAKYDQ